MGFSQGLYQLINTNHPRHISSLHPLFSTVSVTGARLARSGYDHVVKLTVDGGSAFQSDTSRGMSTVSSLVDETRFIRDQGTRVRMGVRMSMNMIRKFGLHKQMSRERETETYSHSCQSKNPIPSHPIPSDTISNSPTALKQRFSTTAIPHRTRCPYHILPYSLRPDSHERRTPLPQPPSSHPFLNTNTLHPPSSPSLPPISQSHPPSPAAAPQAAHTHPLHQPWSADTHAAAAAARSRSAVHNIHHSD